jgi:putative flippase GtrA
MPEEGLALSRLRSKRIELPRYFVVSCCALLVDAAVLLLLNSGLSVPYLPAAALSFILGGVVAYLLSKRFVWDTGDHAKTHELPLFVLLGLVGLGVNALILFALVGGLHLPVMLAKAFAAGCTFLCNYTLRRQFVFSKARSRVGLWVAECDE